MIKVKQEIKYYFCVLADILNNIGSILTKSNVFAQKNSRNSMEATSFNFRGFLRGFYVCFGTASFDTDTYQCEVLYKKEGHLFLYPVIWLFCVQGK